MMNIQKNRATVLTLLFMLCSVLVISGCKEEKAPDMTVGRPTMNILFVGNDLTYMHNMPYMVQLLAQTDPSAHFKIDLQMHVALGASLAQLWNNPTTRDVLTSKPWDYVIIQPHHMWAATEGSVYLTRQSLSAWSSQIKNIKASPSYL